MYRLLIFRGALNSVHILSTNSVGRPKHQLAMVNTDIDGVCLSFSIVFTLSRDSNRFFGFRLLVWYSIFLAFLDTIHNIHHFQDFFIGESARKLRGVLKLNQPMRHGVINDWQDMSHIWRHTFQELNVAQEEVRFSHSSTKLYSLNWIVISIFVWIVFPSIRKTAPCVDHRGSVESAQESRQDGGDFLRELQRTRSLCGCPGHPLTVRLSLILPSKILWWLSAWDGSFWFSTWLFCSSCASITWHAFVSLLKYCFVSLPPQVRIGPNHRCGARFRRWCHSCCANFRRSGFQSPTCTQN